jgi:hypothetical protein
MVPKTTKIANGPQSGAVTHHHDQSILSVNFNTKKTMKVQPKSPIPPPVRATLLSAITTSQTKDCPTKRQSDNGEEEYPAT